ncbi:hypothetical protein N7U66_02555 [Lacinutrix neustonica]|uniref:Uncharacterized protein n=1 Tax=Lacinutrix neustonica TaxID=2980107 RepID=A0A9E8MVZ3_9FLAO|nr:hypothetical protein [Lacinutrix neustonica]WAC02593.1 hypothetical protein N7U66_02555 [Lacinutrix neustonica]
MTNRIKIEQLRLYINGLILLYFCMLIGVYYFKVEVQIIRILGELLTIPALLGLIGIPIWALIDNLRGKNKNASIYVMTLLITLSIFTVLFVANSYLK